MMIKIDPSIKKMFDKKTKYPLRVISHLWDRRKDIMRKMKLAKEGEIDDFHSYPLNYISKEIYRGMSVDIVDRINEMLWYCVDHNNGKCFTKRELVDLILWD